MGKIGSEKQKSVNKKVQRIKVKSKATGDKNISKDHRFAFKIEF